MAGNSGIEKIVGWCERLIDAFNRLTPIGLAALAFVFGISVVAMVVLHIAKG